MGDHILGGAGWIQLEQVGDYTLILERCQFETVRAGGRLFIKVAGWRQFEPVGDSSSQLETVRAVWRLFIKVAGWGLFIKVAG